MSPDWIDGDGRRRRRADHDRKDRAQRGDTGDDGRDRSWAAAEYTGRPGADLAHVTLQISRRARTRRVAEFAPFVNSSAHSTWCPWRRPGLGCAAWLLGPSRSTPAPTGRCRATVAVVTLGAFVFRQPWVDPGARRRRRRRRARRPGRQPVPPDLRRARRAPALARPPTSSRRRRSGPRTSSRSRCSAWPRCASSSASGGIAWIVTLAEAGVAAVAATTGVHLGVEVRDRLRRMTERPWPARGPRRTALTGERRGHRDRIEGGDGAEHDAHARSSRPRCAPDGDRRSRAPRGAPSTPLRTIDGGADRRLEASPRRSTGTARGAPARARARP